MLSLCALIGKRRSLTLPFSKPFIFPTFFKLRFVLMQASKARERNFQGRAAVADAESLISEQSSI